MSTMFGNFEMSVGQPVCRFLGCENVEFKILNRVHPRAIPMNMLSCYEQVSANQES